MPLTMPPTSVLNFRPTSTAAASFESTIQGTVSDGVQIEHGHVACVTVTIAVPDGCSRFALSSVARAMIDAVPSTPGTHVYVQFALPVARRHDTPPSVETSTPATAPPPPSVAVPATVTIVPAAMLAPSAGEVMVDTGRVVSVLAVAGMSAL